MESEFDQFSANSPKNCLRDATACNMQQFVAQKYCIHLQGGVEKRAMVVLLVFLMATLAEENFWTLKVHLAVTLLKIRLEL